MQDHIVRRALVAAAVQKPIKRKSSRRYSEDTNTWTSHSGNEAGKRRIFSMPSHDPTPLIPGLGATMVAPPDAHHLRERFSTAARAMPVAMASTPMRPVVETEWMAMNASVYLLTSNQAERLTATTPSNS